VAVGAKIGIATPGVVDTTGWGSIAYIPIRLDDQTAVRSNSDENQI